MLMKQTRRLSLSNLDCLDLDSEVEDTETQEAQIANERPRMQRRNSMTDSLRDLGSSTRRLITCSTNSAKVSNATNDNSGGKYEKVDRKLDGLSKGSHHARPRMGSSRNLLGLGSSHHSRRGLGRSSHHKPRRNNTTPKRYASDNTEATEWTADATQHSHDATTREIGSDYDAMELLDTIDMYIGDLSERKSDLEQQYQTELELATARFQNGSRGPSTLVAMRSAMKKKDLKAKVVSVLFQLIEMRKQVSDELDRVRAQLMKSEVAKLNMDIQEASVSAENMLRQLDREKCSVMNDEALLQQLNVLVEQSN